MRGKDHIQLLTEALDRIDYPAGINKLTPKLRQGLFFPGARGFYDDDGRPGYLPVRGVLVLAHNYGSTKYSLDDIRTVTTDPTIQLLRDGGVDPRECFFTNALMGLMDAESEVGSHRGHRDQSFLRGCTDVLHETVHLMQPRATLILGKPARMFVVQHLCGLESWSGKSFKAIDAMGPVGCITLPSGASMAVVPLVHPSMGNSNWRHRRFAGVLGRDAEVSMIRAATAV